ncbi:histidine kinase [Saccharomonospora sp. NPDC046836]|uniref:sensor histidine kinase n=1 Tax=Saccharomonospora sp. NPDC046836 TaxID=3156921 RepID=UPI0034089B7E
MLSRFLQRFPLLVWAPIRFVPLVSTVAYLSVLSSPLQAGKWDWTLGTASAVATIAGGRLPMVVTVTQSALVILGAWVVPAPVAWPLLFALAVIAVGELMMRRHGLPCWLGGTAYFAAMVVVNLPDLDSALMVPSIALATLPPMLLGLYIRSVLRVAMEARHQRETAVLEARAAERTAIARELHDLVAHYMASVAMRVGAARVALGTAEPEVGKALADVHDTARTALTDLRRLVSTLRDPASIAGEAGAALAEPDGLAGALVATVERARSAGLILDAEIDPAVTALDAMRRLAVLRVVQEGLTNVIKHAGARTKASLRVRALTDEVRVEVRDDGGGSAASDPRDGGFGLVGIRERVELLGGSMHAGALAQGWELSVAVPTGAVEALR